ncbi:MAG: hypothetical protein DDT26_00209 [Dehalococcoidia bacterium]|nr:hypothetical protein [Chloroflexota bacterium]
MPDFNFVDCDVYINTAGESDYNQESDCAPIASVSIENYIRRAIASGVESLNADVEITAEGRVLIHFQPYAEDCFVEVLSYSAQHNELCCETVFTAGAVKPTRFSRGI